MLYQLRKTINLSGQDLLLSPLDIDFAHRTLSLAGDITDETAVYINSALRCLARDSDEDITLYLFSPGGTVAAGLSIYDTVQSLNCDVCTVACGMTASIAAFLLAAAGAKGKRWCQPSAEVLIHQPLGDASGRATDIRIQAEHILNLRTKLNQLWAACTGNPIAKIERDTESDRIMDAQTALQYGLVDHIGDPFAKCE